MAAFFGQHRHLHCLDENCCTLIQISLKCVREYTLENTSTSFKLMVKFTDTCLQSLGLDELTNNMPALNINVLYHSLEQFVRYLYDHYSYFVLDCYVFCIAIHLTDCPRYRWGLGCINHCNCFEPCDGTTGNCTAGCIPGKMGISCQECESGGRIQKYKFIERKRTAFL